MKIKLHYAELTNQGDIPCIERPYKKTLTSRYNAIFSFLDMKVNPSNKDRVFLLANDFNDVIIDDDFFRIMEKLRKSFMITENIFWQEYPSYEEAYKVALSMKETSPLCYNDNEKLDNKIIPISPINPNNIN